MSKWSDAKDSVLWRKAKTENLIIRAKAIGSNDTAEMLEQNLEKLNTELEALDIAERAEDIATITLVSKHYCSQYCNAHGNCKGADCLDFYEVCDTVNAILADVRGDTEWNTEMD